ncbi:GmrSD restriction endonuclease domain-containing protein [Bacillus altitudinis]|uniref:GmrSD restriction endonuclease domain-containing protein n=1 Tax=Bacillus altitudinis TaxID=293387 RepID=UPI003315772E
MNATIRKSLSILSTGALFDASKEKREIYIRQLCEDIEQKKIVIPVFQTYIRWTNIKVAELLNYQLHGAAPISPISVNLITKPEKVVEQMNFITREVLTGDEIKNKMSVADGQQRLSANFKCFVNHEDISDVVLDLKKAKFVVINENEELEDYQIPAGIIYNKDTKVFKEFVRNNKTLKQEEVKDVLEDIRRKHFTYTYVINLATDLGKDDQQKWFEVLNLEGSRVTGNMVYLSEMLINGLDFYTQYVYPFTEKLDRFNLGHLFPRKSAEVSIPLATLNSAYYKHTGLPKTSNSSPIPSDAKPKQIGKLKVHEIEHIIEQTLAAMDNVLEFISVNSESLTEINRIDYLTYLIGLFVECDVDSHINEMQKQYIIDWCNNVEFVNNSNSERREKFDSLLESYKAI